MITRLRNWLAQHRQNNLRALVSGWRRGSAEIQRRLEEDRRELVDLSDRLEVLAGRVRGDLERAETSQRQYEITINAALERIRVLEDIAVPGLTEAAKSLEERFRTITAIETMKQANLSGSSERIES